jgi:hypothetical protein
MKNINRLLDDAPLALLPYHPAILGSAIPAPDQAELGLEIRARYSPYSRKVSRCIRRLAGPKAARGLVDVMPGRGFPCEHRFAARDSVGALALAAALLEIPGVAVTIEPAQTSEVRS